MTRTCSQYIWPCYFKYWRKWAGTRCSKNSCNILEHLTCKVKKPPWRNMENFQNFSSTKEQNLQNKFTLPHLWTWNNVYTDIFYNLQMDWLTNCSSGSSQLSLFNLQFTGSHFWITLLLGIIMFSRRSSKFYVAVLLFQNWCNRQKTVLTSNGYSHLNIFQ